MPGPHVDDKKGKKAMVYKARKDRRKRDPEQKEKEKKRVSQDNSVEYKQELSGFRFKTTSVLNFN